MDNINISNELKIVDRNILTLNGVKKIIKFDNQEFIIDNILGIIYIKGNNLELLTLDTSEGIIKIKGIINSFMYADKNKKKDESFLAKLFK